MNSYFSSARRARDPNFSDYKIIVEALHCKFYTSNKFPSPNI